MSALVTGATGFVGRRLLGQLERPRVLSRDAEAARRKLSEHDVEASVEPEPVTRRAAGCATLDQRAHLSVPKTHDGGRVGTCRTMTAAVWGIASGG